MEAIPGWDEPAIEEMPCGCKARMSWGEVTRIALCPEHKKEFYENRKERLAG